MIAPISLLRGVLPLFVVLPWSLAAQAGDGQVPTQEEIAAAVVPAAPPASVAEVVPAAPPASVAEAAPKGLDTSVVWQGDPIPVDLKVQVERRIDFPEPIAEIDVPRALERQSRIVLTPTGHLHWTAEAPFAPTRVLATSVSGSLYQLDVHARPDGEAPSRMVLSDPVLDAAALAEAKTPDTRAQREQAAARLIPDFLKAGAAGTGSVERPGYVALARFALAHFTGPRRLIPKLDATRVAVRPIDTRAWLRVQSAVLTIQPLAQWKVGDRYVTALGVYNRGAMDVPFDPRALRGDLRFVAALHPTLGPRGSGHNGTVWAVITSQPFNRVLDHEPALTVSR